MTLSIGVLAGMGPRSTAPFIDMLITQCQMQYGAKNDMDFPRIHIISLPTPFYPGRNIDNNLMIKCLRSGVSDLLKVGVSFISIPCNLAHIYFDEMNDAANGIEILHIADCSIKRISAHQKDLALLATQPTIASGIYEKRFFGLGKRVVNSSELNNITYELIASIKKSGYKDSRTIELWNSVKSEIKNLKAHATLIACTDVSPLIDASTNHLEMIDTAESLALATIKKYIDTRS